MCLPDSVETLKRVANSIFKTGGFIRKIENWGEKNLPYKISNHGTVFKQAGYFWFCFDVPPSSLKDLMDEYQRDVDIVKTTIFKTIQPKEQSCTLQEELLPPPYRSNVAEILEKYKKTKDKSTYKMNTGFDYYPFSR
ncbi:mitochondrial ribosomal protein S6 isoform X2 [Nomia melanderi]|uniref:mitochondrial ribosomal protein S6 isoform X2 n=1 Tax=Nomia melanderi TaxID=2448451 RepID=UPI0013045F96|nr:probable 28S ribosomal protein S6, mitochondrial isoform X2 [Nomia melanderi]